MRVCTHYQWNTGKCCTPMRVMVVSDLHNTAYEDLLPMLEGVDALLVAGDTADRYRQRYERGIQFLKEAAERVPTFVGIGNHEFRLADFAGFCEAVEETRATLLVNRCVQWNGLAIGGWYRPELLGHADPLPQLLAEEGCRILLCHHPEDYMNRLRPCNVDLVLAGHAHGGQIRVCGRGLYAPGQGIFPRYTRGVIDERMIVSAGAGNPICAPRWGNPCEALMIDLT